MVKVAGLNVYIGCHIQSADIYDGMNFDTLGKNMPFLEFLTTTNT